MDNFMIDIETLGTGSNSVILSIGAVEFDPDSDDIGEGFHVLVNIDSCLNKGLIVSGSTLCWWMTQSEEARNIFNRQSESLHLASALLALRQYMLGKSAIPIVWANGTDFDLAILQNAYSKVDIEQPWSYYNGRDYRTIKAMLPKKTFDKLRVKPEVAHDAYHDALAQARTLQNILGFGRTVAVEDVKQA